MLPLTELICEFWVLRVIGQFVLPEDDPIGLSNTGCQFGQISAGVEPFSQLII